MADIKVGVALASAPVNIVPLVDSSNAIVTSIVYNSAGMALKWNFVTVAGTMTQTAVTPTTAGNYDWANKGGGMYSIEVPASGGASANNDTVGTGWFSGVVDGVLPFRGPELNILPADVADIRSGGTSLGVAQSGDSYTRLGAPAGASVSADIAAVQTDTNAIEFDTQDIQARLPAALTGAGNMKSDALAISGDTTAADNAELFYDGTGYNASNSAVGTVGIVTTVGTVTTVTNLTNAPTAGDLTATMKSSVTTAATAATPTVTLNGSQGIKKNTAKAAFPFLMTDSTNHLPATGLTVTATRSLDGAAFGACANSVTELSNGVYLISLAAGDLNGNTVCLKFTASGADQQTITIVTSP